MRKLVLSFVTLLVLVGASLAGWKWWGESQRSARYAEWRTRIEGKDDAQRAEVVKALREELKVEPGLVEARTLLGEALAHSGNLSDAAVELRDAAKRDPNDIKVRRVLAQVCLALDLVDEAIKVLNEAFAHANEHERPAVELELARACMERYRGSSKDADFRSARNYFQDARHDPATEAEAMDGYAALWLTKGPNFDFDKAIATYRELLAKYPAYTRAEKIRGLLEAFDNREKNPPANAGADAPAADPKAPAKDGDAGKEHDAGKDGDG